MSSTGALANSTPSSSGAVTVTSFNSTQLNTLNASGTATFPVTLGGPSSLPTGSIAVTASGGNITTRYNVFTPTVTSGSFTYRGVTVTTPTTYLDLVTTGGHNPVSNITRTLALNWGASASSLNSGDYEYEYVIGIAGLFGWAWETSTVTSSQTLTSIGNIDAFGTGYYSNLNGVHANVAGLTGTSVTTNQNPFGLLTWNPNGYTFYTIPGSASGMTLNYTGNDFHGLVFGVIWVAKLTATNDSGTGTSGTASTPISNVASNDTVANAPITIGTNGSVSTSGTWPAGFSLNTASGAVMIDATVAAGSYTLTYQLCDTASHCTTADAAVTVGLGAIATDADSVSDINGLAGSNNVLDVLAGDTFNSNPAMTTNVDLTVVTPATPVISGGLVPVLGADGLIDVPASTPAGSYAISYKICDKINASNCSTNTATVTVAPSVNLSISKSNGKTNVFSGEAVTYAVTVTNTGPDTAVGAVVTDVVGTGLTCPAAGAVTITGSGVPVGSFSIANLTGAGITLGTLATGQTAILSYTCQVN